MELQKEQELAKQLGIEYNEEDVKRSLLQKEFLGHQLHFGAAMMIGAMILFIVLAGRSNEEL